MFNLAHVQRQAKNHIKFFQLRHPPVRPPPTNQQNNLEPPNDGRRNPAQQHNTTQRAVRKRAQTATEGRAPPTQYTVKIQSPSRPTGRSRTPCRNQSTTNLRSYLLIKTQKNPPACQSAHPQTPKQTNQEKVTERRVHKLPQKQINTSK